jgi:tetratricopeptide (TPR) repeat protein
MARTFLFSRLPLVILAAVLFLTTGCQSNVEKYRNQGVKLYQQDQYDQSLQTFNKALSYDQFDAVSNTYAGLIHYRAGNYEQAAYHSKVALQSDPSSEQAKEGLTAALIKLNKPDLALDYLERAAALAEKVDDPRWKKTYANRRYQNQTEEGLYVGKADDRLRIARTYEKLGDYDNAAVYYEKALKVAPKSPEVLLAMANMYEKTGNKAQARECLIRAYNISPATPGLTEAMTRNGVSISDIIGTPLK